MTSQHLEQYQTESPNVPLITITIVTHYLGSHIKRRSNIDESILVYPRLSSGKSQIAKPYLPVLPNQNVSRLDIPMNKTSPSQSHVAQN